MAFLADLRTFLLAQATITDSVGAEGVYEDLAKRDATYPRIVYSRLSTTFVDDLTGIDPQERVMVSFDLQSTVRGDTDTLETNLKTLLSGYRGTMGETPVQAGIISGLVNLVDTPSDGSDNTIYRTVIDYEFWLGPI